MSDIALWTMHATIAWSALTSEPQPETSNQEIYLGRVYVSPLAPAPGKVQTPGDATVYQFNERRAAARGQEMIDSCWRYNAEPITM